MAATAGNGIPGARALLTRGLRSVFGPPPYDPRRAPGDPGMFGPGSATWQVIAEPAAIAGGLRGLLVQLLHPLAMAGVSDHSRFREDPLGRLQRTSGYVTAMAFASLDEALGITAGVRRGHRVVSGRAPDGRPYRAEDPHLLAWVSIALTSSFLATDRAFSPAPVEGDRADAFVAEQSRAAALLDPRVDLAPFRHDAAARSELRDGAVDLPMLADGSLPTSVAGLQKRLADYRPELEVGDQGREALRFLLRPDLPLPVRLGHRPLAAGALATIPPELRALLGVRLPAPLAAAMRAQARTLLRGLRATAGRSYALRVAEERVASGA